MGAVEGVMLCFSFILLQIKLNFMWYLKGRQSCTRKMGRALFCPFWLFADKQHTVLNGLGWGIPPFLGRGGVGYPSPGGHLKVRGGVPTSIYSVVLSEEINHLIKVLVRDRYLLLSDALILCCLTFRNQISSDN